MTQVIKLACLQMSSGPNMSDNIATVEAALSVKPDLDLLLLPENFAQMPACKAEQYSEYELDGEVQQALSQLATRFSVSILAGSLAIRDSEDSKPFARSLLFNVKGELVGQYDKLHLFDVNTQAQVDVNTQARAGSRYRESDTYRAGAVSKKQLSPVSLQIGQTSLQLGLTICYDLRFPELYRTLAAQGAQVICVPSAFTYETGQAHWEALLRARAIENQVFIIAPAQTGKHASGRKTWGHSMVIDPWGAVLAQKNTGEGLVFAELDLTTIESLRARFPVHQHKRLQPN